MEKRHVELLSDGSSTNHLQLKIGEALVSAYMDYIDISSHHFKQKSIAKRNVPPLLLPSLSLDNISVDLHPHRLLNSDREDNRGPRPNPEQIPRPLLFPSTHPYGCDGIPRDNERDLLTARSLMSSSYKSPRRRRRSDGSSFPFTSSSSGSGNRNPSTTLPLGRCSSRMLVIAVTIVLRESVVTSPLKYATFSRSMRDKIDAQLLLGRGEGFVEVSR